MTPLSLLPPMKPMAPPEKARDTVQSLAQQSRQATAHLENYRQAFIATGEGVVLSVLAMEQDSAITEEFPPDSFLAAPNAEDDFSIAALLLYAGRRIESLSALSATHQFRLLLIDGDGYEVEAFSQFAGFTSAVPFKAHFIPGLQLWRCIGGKFRQTQGTTEKEFTVPTVDLEITRGLLGIRYQFAAGFNAAPSNSTDHWVTRAAWEAITDTDASVSTMGIVEDSGRRSAGSLFVPLYAITDTPHLRAFPLPFQSIQSTGAYWFPLIPAGISGTLLRA